MSGSPVNDVRLAELIQSFEAMSDVEVARDTLAVLREVAELRAEKRWLIEDRDRWQKLATPAELLGAVELELGSIFEVPLLDLLTSIYAPDEAATWLRTPQPLLGGAIPRDLVKTEEGRARVLMVLGALADGNHL